MPGDITYALRLYAQGKLTDTHITDSSVSAYRMLSTLVAMHEEDQWFDTVRLTERTETSPRSEGGKRTCYDNRVVAYWSVAEGNDGD